MSSDYKNWKIGASSCFYRRFDDEMLAEFAAAGLSCVELSFRLNEYDDKLDFVGHPERIAEKAAKHGVELWSLHLPFSGDYDISMADDAKRTFTMENNIRLLGAAAKAGVKVLVVHPSSEPIADSDRPARMKRCRENLLILAEKAASAGMRLAVEDLPRTCLGRHSDEILEMLDGNPALSVCFDTNHLLMQKNVDFIRAVGSRIITLHVTDYDFIDERHQLPLRGKNDWKAIIAELEKVGYAGPWLYELGAKDELCAASLAENKRELGRL